jgi:hypothetical protein
MRILTKKCEWEKENGYFYSFKKLAKVGHVLFSILELIFCFFKWVVIGRQQNVWSGSYGSKSVLKYPEKIIWYISNLVEGCMFFMIVSLASYLISAANQGIFK